MKLIKKLVIFIFLSSIFVGNSYSNEKDFEIIGESGRAIYLIDRKSVKKSDDDKYVEFILITSLKKPEKLNDNRNYFSVRTTSHADCNDKKVKDILTEFYDGKADDGNVTKVNLLKTDKSPEDMWFEASTPGKVNTVIVNKACNIHTANSKELTKEQIEFLDNILKDEDFKKRMEKLKKRQNKD